MPALYSPAELEAAAGLELLSQATPFLSRCATISGSEAATPEAEAAGPTITVRLNVNQLALESKPKPRLFLVINRATGFVHGKIG